MNAFTTYGMMGIGIAAAIGFVFALSILANNVGVETKGYDSEGRPASSLDLKQGEQSPSDSGSGAPLFSNQGQATPTEAGKSSGIVGPQLSPLMSRVENESTSDQLTLEAVIASKADGQLIGNLVPGMEFDLDEPIFIRANFSNYNDEIVRDHAMTMIIRKVADGDSSNSSGNGNSNGNSNNNNNNNDTYTPNTTSTTSSPIASSTTITPLHGAGEDSQPTDQIAGFRGNIGAGSTLGLELYWKPEQAGRYNLLLFSVASIKEESANPTSIIPIIVIVAHYQP